MKKAPRPRLDRVSPYRHSLPQHLGQIMKACAIVLPSVVQLISLHQRNTRGVIYPTHDRSVSAGINREDNG